MCIALSGEPPPAADSLEFRILSLFYISCQHMTGQNVISQEKWATTKKQRMAHTGISYWIVNMLRSVKMPKTV